MKIRKAIIPAAGLGTRFLPVTKVMPKEMLPIVDTPAIQFIVEEAVASGIEDIIIVSGKGKRAIEDHFDRSFELEKALLEKGNIELYEKVISSSNLADIHYIRQKEPRGLGHAVWCARKFIGNEPFAVLLGDDIVQSAVPCLKQMMDIFYQNQSSVIGVQPVPYSEVSRYGIVDGEFMGNGLYEARDFIEKPSMDKAPSNLAIMGRYILTPAIFDILEHQEVGAGGEIQLTDAIASLNDFERVLAFEFNGKRHDIGDKVGFIKTTIEYALKKEEMRSEILNFIHDIIAKEANIKL
ncbi:UTP--glucose-1-phosphate uridylyltransferase [Paenibacillus shirakamiensis]|uniref:UTP--glucose-1-phosphate uridylyltransferase n=1 Tax=Paenibacillus shirakamiensis TaxID=1265935 RepID=A0ABS4JDY0_9BACL|nr:UTP--glucose-1-phosphate uridylyltransferase GalU [Paenibacillus shirakamiensis]MBP1999929.1 UTP--glucose-1-phosphate uridylyltransferase [Paenibacillus shirakamiensis]